MTFRDLIPLVECYGFEIKFHKPHEKKMRFQGRGTFIDIWCSKRGTTLGIYNPNISRCKFFKKLSMVELEKAIMNVNYTGEAL